MALLGTGVLAIWNNIAPGWENEFLEWHVKEHIPERIGVKGFLRGRRYISVDGTPVTDLTLSAIRDRLCRSGTTVVLGVRTGTATATRTLTLRQLL